MVLRSMKDKEFLRMEKIKVKTKKQLGRESNLCHFFSGKTVKVKHKLSDKRRLGVIALKLKGY